MTLNKETLTIEETEVENTEATEAIETEEEKYTDDELENQYIESLDIETVTVAGMEFNPSDILKNCDPTAYRCGLNDFIDGFQEYETKYKCPICNEEHDDEDEAKFCCQDEYITKYIITDENGDEIDSDLFFDTETEAQLYIENEL